jgi:hypothetical protein
MDQTGVHLVPASNWTYEEKGAASVAVVGAEDKRQITACVASSLSGELLPLQLIFQGKTPRSLPPATAASIASGAHLTFSDNHWSNQTTMQQYIEKIILPFAETCIERHRLRADARIMLVLDVWSVHKSEEFRRFIRTKHPRIHLVFIPPNCTSKLQVADVALQRPFKSSISKQFNQWAGGLVAEQIADGAIIGLAEALKMSNIKPLALQWCIESWKELKERRDLILSGWHRCCVQLYDVNDPQKRTEAVVEVAEGTLELAYLPDGEEQDEEESDHEERSDDDLDTSKPRIFGKQSMRERAPAKPFGYQLSTDQIAMTEDSDCN